MMAATKINSFESDRCPVIAVENGTRHGERGSHLHGNWIFKSRKWDHVCYACSLHLLILRFHNSQQVCTTEVEEAQALVHHLLYLHVHMATHTHKQAGSLLIISISPQVLLMKLNSHDWAPLPLNFVSNILPHKSSSIAPIIPHTKPIFHSETTLISTHINELFHLKAFDCLPLDYKPKANRLWRQLLEN